MWLPGSNFYRVRDGKRTVRFMKSTRFYTPPGLFVNNDWTQEEMSKISQIIKYNINNIKHIKTIKHKINIYNNT